MDSEKVDLMVKIMNNCIRTKRQWLESLEKDLHRCLPCTDWKDERSITKRYTDSEAQMNAFQEKKRSHEKNIANFEKEHQTHLNTKTFITDPEFLWELNILIKKNREQLSYQIRDLDILEKNEIGPLETLLERFKTLRADIEIQKNEIVEYKKKLDDFLREHRPVQDSTSDEDTDSNSE
jgi:hypothetical protein